MLCWKEPTFVNFGVSRGLATPLHKRINWLNRGIKSNGQCGFNRHQCAVTSWAIREVENTSFTTGKKNMAVGVDWRCPRDSGYWTRLSALNPLWYNSSPELLLFQRALSFGGTTISRARLVSCCCRYYRLPRTTVVRSREWVHPWSSCIAPLVLTLGILISACICSSLFPFFV